jgi:O-antigen ligase
MDIRRLVNTTLIIFAVTAGVSVAVGLLILGVSGSIWQSILGIMVIAGFVGSMMSLEFSIYALLVLGLIEGIYKTISPSFFTLIIKDIQLMFIVVRFLYISLRDRNFSWFSQSISAPFVLFAAYATAMMAAPSTHSLRLALAGFRSWILWIPIYYPAYVCFRDRETQLRLMKFVCYASVPIAAYGIYQSIMGYDHLAAVPELADAVKWYVGRATSILNSPPLFANFCAIATFLSLGFVMYYKRPPQRLLFFGIAVLAVGGMMSSGTRGAFLGALVGLVVFVMLLRRKALMMIILGIAVLISLKWLIPTVAETGTERIVENVSVEIVADRLRVPFQRSWEELNKRPLGYGLATGSGSGRIFDELRVRSLEHGQLSFIENEIGRVLAEMGIPGFVFWVWMLYVLMRTAIRTARNAPKDEDHYIFCAMVAPMVSMMTQLVIGGALYDAASGIYFWIFAAILTRESHDLARARAREAEALRQTHPEEAAESIPAGG